MSLTQAELQSIASEPYEHRGILHSEMALIIHTCRRLEIDVVIESGRARGQSTYMLAKYLPQAAIYSVEMRGGEDQDFGRQRLADFANVALIEGDGAVLLPKLAAEASGRTAILCDGPKGIAAVNLLKSCFAYSHVLVGFLHDMRKLDHGKPSPHRAAAIAAFPDAKFSDDPRLIGGAIPLDVKVLEAGGSCGPEHEKEFGSYGPTVCVAFNPRNKQ